MTRKPTPWIVTSLLSLSAWSLPALAQDAPAAAPAAPAPAAVPAPAAAAAPAAAPEVTPAAPAPGAAPAKKKAAGGGGSLGLSPEAPQASGLVATSVAVAAPAAEEPATGEWKFDVTGYFRAPMRFSWGPPTVPTITQNGMQVSTAQAGTQFRTPPLVPDANYIDWRYTNSFVAPWTELNFHYGNDRVKATVQIASYNVTDSGYRRLESNLGINEAFLQMTYPELANVENLHLELITGAYTNRYGAAGRYDAGRYETYLLGRTHVAGETVNIGYDVDDFTIQGEQSFGAKLEPIPFYGAPLGSSAGNIMPGATTTTGNANQDLPAWEPYPGPFAQESTFVWSAHLGASWKKMATFGLHYIGVFANDNEAATAYEGAAFGTKGRAPGDPKPYLHIYGADLKFLGGVFGDGYIGYSHLSAQNAIYLADAIEVLHSFGGWQLHDNYFGPPGGTDAVTGKIDSVEFQYSFSFGQLFHYPQAFWGEGPDIIGTIFGMFNHVDPQNPSYKMNKLKFGTEWTYVPLSWLGLGARFDVVEPNTDVSAESFSVISPRIIFRTAFVTHEQVMLQYSRYFYGSAYVPGNPLGGGMFPYNSQTGGAGLGVDKNAAQIAAIIWF